MSSLELLAFDYMEFVKHYSYAFILIVFFTVIIGPVKKVDFRVQRGTYFLGVGFFVFLASVAQAIWFLLFSAIVSGYTFAIVLLDILIWALLAYALVVIAKARSNDAYGHSRYFVLAFIPIASFWLNFTRSIDDNVPRRPFLLRGVSAVLIGFVLFGAARVLTEKLKSSIQNYGVTNIEYESKIKIRNKHFEYYAQRDGLEEALEYLKTLEKIESRIDEITILKNIEITEDTLTYKFLITDNQITGFTQESESTWKNYICDDQADILKQGATIAFHYYSEVNPMLAYVAGNEESCSM